MRQLVIGLGAFTLLMCAGLISKPAEAAPMIPAVKHQNSLVQDVGWRRRYARRRVVRGPVVRDSVRRTTRRRARRWR